MKKRCLNVGIIGLGTVGTGVARLLLEQAVLLKQRSGLEFRLKAIAELDWQKERDLNLEEVAQLTDAGALINDPEIDIVVETIGGHEPAFSFISKALNNKKHVVTANKALVATKGPELFALAAANQVSFLFEASVGGGIPIIKGLREGLVANRIEKIFGILNGTSNFILTRMHEKELEFADVLKEAQEKGFAEADPTLDISGGDAAHKLVILASLAANGTVDFQSLQVEGITEITKMDINFAKNFGYTIKLLAIYRQLDGGLDLRVHPTLVPNSHLLAAVNNELNAVFVRGDFVGDTMFYGPGAGERPTASAIVSDILDLVAKVKCCENPAEELLPLIDTKTKVRTIPVCEIENRFYLRFFTKDEPGILAKIAGVLGEKGISISSMVQLESHEIDHYIPIVLLTHEAKEAAMTEAWEIIKAFDFVSENCLKLRLF